MNRSLCERRRICFNGFELKLIILIAQVYSITTGGWYTPEVTGKKPPARSGHSAALLNDKMLIFGGWDMPAVFNDVHVFDLTFAEWTTPDNIQVPFLKSHYYIEHKYIAKKRISYVNNIGFIKKYSYQVNLIVLLP